MYVGVSDFFLGGAVAYVAFVTRQPTPHRFPVAILHGRYYYFAYHCFSCTYIPAALALLAAVSVSLFCQPARSLIGTALARRHNRTLNTCTYVVQHCELRRSGAPHNNAPSLNNTSPIEATYTYMLQDLGLGGPVPHARVAATVKI